MILRARQDAAWLVFSLIACVASAPLRAADAASPFFGPLACETMKRYAAGETIEPWVQVEDRIFTAENAAESIDGAY